MIVLGLVPTLAAGQGTEPLKQPTSVSLELATALAATGGFGREADPQILVDALPEWLASRFYVPRGARVLGSAFLGTTVMAVISVPTVSEGVLGEFENELKQRGWKAPPPTPSFAGYGGGFRPAPTTAGTVRSPSITLCSADKQTLTGWISRQRATVTTLTFRLGASTGFGGCNPPAGPPDMRRSPIPVLFDPAGATVRGTECREDGSGYGSIGSFTRLHTPMSPGAVLDHYGKQLQDSGWTGDGLGQIIVSRSWARPDSGGIATITLKVTPSPKDSTCHQVELSYTSPRRQP